VGGRGGGGEGRGHKGGRGAGGWRVAGDRREVWTVGDGARSVAFGAQEGGPLKDRRVEGGKGSCRGGRVAWEESGGGGGWGRGMTEF
jgi:hypothetical protein